MRESKMRDEIWLFCTKYSARSLQDERAKRRLRGAGCFVEDDRDERRRAAKIFFAQSAQPVLSPDLNRSKTSESPSGDSRMDARNASREGVDRRL
jgi:hypothetical protein